MTRDEARSVALYVSAGWPGSRLSETSVELWADAISDLAYPVAQRAAREMLQEVPAFPSVAALRERAQRATARDAVAQRPLALPHLDTRTPEQRRASAGMAQLSAVVAAIKRRGA